MKPYYQDDDVAREGFPGMSAPEFVYFFGASMRCRPDVLVTRIEWRYLDAITDPPKELPDGR